MPEIANTYGLRQQVLSPFETLAQSVSSIAPTASPTMVIPLVFAMAGSGTWLAYVLATVAILFVAVCVNEFAGRSASPGSLYSYISRSLGPRFGLVAGWSLLAAYLGTASAVTGGFTNYSNILLLRMAGRRVPDAFLTALAVGLAGAIAYRNVRLSARLMVWLEGFSMVLIGGLTVAVLVHRALHGQPLMPDLSHLSFTRLRGGLVLALFSFVGFESAASLGAEAQQPLRTIPRAILSSAAFVGLFFVLCSHAEVLTFVAQPVPLDKSPDPLHVLAASLGAGFLGTIIDAAAVVSFFACTLACVNAAARILFSMGRNGLVHRAAGTAHPVNQTPHRAIIVCSAAAFLPAFVLSVAHTTPFDIYGWLGTFATFGFIVAYIFIALAAARLLFGQPGAQWWRVLSPGLAVLAMLVALAGSLYPIPPPPYNWLPLIFAGYLVLGTAWVTLRARNAPDPLRRELTINETNQ